MDLRTREGRREQGDLIKAAAIGAGLTLKELATRLGVSHALIYQYVSGANLAQPDKLQEIAQITGLPISYFFAETAAPAGVVHAPEGAEKAPEPAGPPAVDAARLQQSLRQLEVLANAQDMAGRDLTGLLRTLEQMLGLARLAGDQRREAEILFRIGNARTDAGELKSAADSLEECAALFRESGLEEHALQATQSLARCRSLLGDTAEAERLFSLVAASPNLDLRWRGLLGLGQILEQRDRYEESLAIYEQARHAVENLPQDAAVVRALAELYVGMNVGNVYMAEGDFASAALLWQERATLAEDLSLPDQFLEALVSEAVCQLHLARPGLSWDLCRRAVRLSRLLGDQERQAIASASLAEALTTAGLWQESKEEAREAAKLAVECGTSRGVTLSNFALARSLMLSGQADSALYQLDPEIDSSFPKVQAAARVLRAEIRWREGHPDDARADALQASGLMREIGAAHLERAAEVLAALAALQLDDTGAAAASLQRAMALERLTAGLVDTPWMQARAAGELARRRGDLPGAVEGFRRAVTLLQELRADFSSRGVLEACLDDPQKLQVYADAVRMARAAGDADLAHRILQEASWPPLNDAAEETTTDSGQPSGGGAEDPGRGAGGSGDGPVGSPGPE